MSVDKAQSRSKNSIRNTMFSALAFVTKMLVQFAVRAVFIRYFAAGYLGLNGLFTNILNMLSLAELGVGNAIVFSMYKPVAEGDTEKIKSLLRLYRNVYLVISLVITTVGVALIPALPHLIKDAPAVNINLTAVYLLYLAQTVVGYFFAYRRALVFANQRNDIESKVSFFAQIVMAAAQIVVIVLWQNFYVYTAITVVTNALDALVVFLLSYRLFPEIRGKAAPLEKSDTKKITKDTGAMVCHRLGGAVVFSTDSIIISAFVSTTVLGYYSNYSLVVTAFGSIIGLFVTSVSSSVGNLIAQKSQEEVYRIYKALNLVLMWLVGFLGIGMFVCVQDFIRLYSGHEEYVLPFSTMALVCVSFYLTYSRRMTDSFKECAGLFWNDRFKPLFEAGINLGLDFLLVHYIGINGVILATIVSTVTTCLWVEPFVLYKNYFKKNFGLYFVRYAAYASVTVVAGAAAFGICRFIPSYGIAWFLLKFAVCLAVPNLIFLLCSFKTPEFKYLCGVAKDLFKRRRPAQAVAAAEQEQIAGETAGDGTDENSEADGAIVAEGETTEYETDQAENDPEQNRFAEKLQGDD